MEDIGNTQLFCVRQVLHGDIEAWHRVILQLSRVSGKSKGALKTQSEQPELSRAETMLSSKLSAENT